MFAPLELVAPLLFVLTYLGSLCWVHRDAQERVERPVLLTLVIGLVSWPLGLLLWVLFRPEEEDPYAGILEPGEDPLL